MGHPPPSSFACVAFLLAGVAACSGTSSKGATDGGRGDTGPAQCGGAVELLPVVTVLDGQTGAPICDAVLVDNDAGAYLNPCAGSGEDCTGKCSYTASGYGTPSGFSITISAPGYAPSKVTGLLTGACGCGGPCELAQQKTVSLTPVVSADAGTAG